MQNNTASAADCEHVIVCNFALSTWSEDIQRSYTSWKMAPLAVLENITWSYMSNECLRAVFITTVTKIIRRNYTCGHAVAIQRNLNRNRVGLQDCSTTDDVRETVYLSYVDINEPCIVAIVVRLCSQTQQYLQSPVHSGTRRYARTIVEQSLKYKLQVPCFLNLFSRQWRDACCCPRTIRR